MNQIKNHITGNFTQIPNQLINDDSLTDRARFIYVLLASQKDDWTFCTWELCKRLKIHRDTYTKHRKQLIENGWIVVSPQKFRNGRLRHKIYHILPIPFYNYRNSEEMLHKNVKCRKKQHQKKATTEKNSNSKNHLHNNTNNLIIEKSKNNKNYKRTSLNFSTSQNPNPRENES